MNVQSLMGVMLMVGISVSNSVLLIEFANRERDAGKGRRDAVVSGLPLRQHLTFNPVCQVGIWRRD